MCSYFLSSLQHNNYHIVAQGYGGEGFLLKSEKEDIAGTLLKAQDSAHKSSVLVNVLIGTTSFREGSISV